MDPNLSCVQPRSLSRLPGEFLPSVVDKPLPILFATSAHNGFSERAYLAPSDDAAA
jgi:hypothetical protein